MSLSLTSEAGVVQFPLARHAEAAGWTFVPEEEALSRRRGEAGLFFYDELEAALLRLNPGIVTPETVTGLVSQLESIPATLEGNRQMLAWLRGQEGVSVPSEKRRRQVMLVDYDHLERNVFQITVEWGFRQKWKKGNRPDIVFLINGVPVALVECKNPKLRNAMEKAVLQLRRYELETPEMMTAPQVFNITHLVEYFYGVTWNYERKNVFNWKQQMRPALQYPDRPPKPPLVLRDGEGGQPLAMVAEGPAGGGYTTYGDAVRAFFQHEHFLTLLKEWILFFVKDDELKKTVLRQHQTRAVAKVVERCLDPEKKRGLVWHTQGSGKTFTMITSARLLLEGNRPGGPEA